MIPTIFRLSWLNLSRDRVALLLTFVLPIVFFSIFASVFGAMDEGSERPLATALVVEDEHPVSAQLAESLDAEASLEVLNVTAEGGRDQLRDLMRSGRATIGVVIPPGFGAGLASPEEQPVQLEILADRSNPMAVGLVGGILRSATLGLGLQAMLDSGLAGGALPEGDGEQDPAATFEPRVIDFLGNAEKRPSVAFFAAGIGVMFLLFAVSGRSAILIEERESGVLVRMLAARVTMTQLLVGRWLFLVALGALQVSVMFVWAATVFGLDLWTPRHLAGFVVMTLTTAAAAAAFGLVLSSACRTRAQLNGVAAVVVLILSALGGSMFPSFLMSERLQAIGKLTFNAWALEGYQQVFWYEATVSQLWPQVLVLSGFCLAFLVIARGLARRWQTS